MSNLVSKTSGTDRQRRTLWIVLILNAGLALAFVATGLFGDSSALIANGLDNGSDAAVYGLSLVALSRGARWKQAAARVSGIMLLLFAVAVLIDVARRFTQGSDPIGPTMIGMSIVAGIINYLCLRLLQKLENKDVNLRAATTFSLNDFISNGGIVVAGVLVMWLGVNWPDLVVGLATAAIQLWGGIKILRDAKQDARKNKDNQNG
ncbi:RND transporter [Sphingomonas aurantiaca]|jgi:cobalt-zinc-cadmium efflux system protein|uniref:Cation transporter n=2 Tax=Sphingomonas TaxID=13687 RepID=A0A974S5X0_9SPHN|nr:MULTISPECIES: cation transporter [Sphingomonas]MBB3589253.1 Co/Zn/Cd efflux system component [Sphingomonas sp. BK481]MCP8891440.1 cation transporter [Sphingomonas faeni]QQV79213.1 cation transporter [Sphingomonas aliaeris]VVS99161.1 RND transporter [Sphingomonas aurantiaca]VXC99884.1 RND transporter [Sphingomonas sp. T1]